MSQEPVEIEHVEYIEPGDTAAHTNAQRTLVYQSDGLPCCSGCGCLLLCLAALSLFNIGGVLTGLVILGTAFVLSSAVLRLAGVHRFSPAYAYVLVPVFLVAVNLLTTLFRGISPFTTWEILGATLLIYLFLYLARPLGRR